ncbi:MAG: hypothetical protein H0A75_01155 [Candidatus Methanofishera endochildressiae]|uniref:Uncharacterized protein n=1 Tax=Candidatus Methanofishera endochildressiae TaxID=2738884 RepID=A0A7Z0SD26_9GAMM|nr:hypothetical protein [Candidatus Methanofishera endochildressiae]
MHVAQIVHEAEHFEQHGLNFGKPEFDLDKIRDWKEGITKTLTGGLARLAKQRKVGEWGKGRFPGANSLDVVSETAPKTPLKMFWGGSQEKSPEKAIHV